jgi:rare lipoprotein A
MTRTALAVFALVALSGAIGPAFAEVDGALSAPIAAADTATDLPRFTPSPEAVAAEAGFAEAFAAFDDPAISAAPAPVVEDVAQDIPDGVASWYGREFAGRKTASGERFDPSQYTAAHRTLPFGSKVRVSRNGRSVVVRINDRGPFHGGRVIDLSQAAAEEIGLRRAGSGRVELALLEG